MIKYRTESGDTMLITADNITKHQNIKPILVNASFTIEEKDKIALIGINGAGKSTLLKILIGEEEIEEGSIIRKNGLRISYLAQEPVFEEEETILHQIVSMDKEIQEYEAKSILGKLGIQDVGAIVSTLSGGQRKRVALAKALLHPCDLLLLDEPTNHLDNTMIEWLENYLKRFSKAIFMVTHDRYFMERVCTKMIEIHQATLYSYDANYSTYLQMKEERMQTEAAQEKKRQSILKKELAWMRAGVQARGTKSKERINRFHKLNDMDNLQQEQNVQIDTITSRLGRKTIELVDISKAYGSHVLFHNFSYHMKRTDRIGIIGPNGCGKSTLLHMIAKEMLPDTGEVIHGETVRIAYFKQGHEDMDPNQKLIDYIRNTSDAIVTESGTYSASQMLEQFLFDSKQQYTTISRLSGGEKRRLYLLKVLMSAPNILFLDEPTNDLDIMTLQILEDYLDNFNGAIVVVSHDRYFLDRICDSLFIFQSDSTIQSFIGGYSAMMELSAINQVKDNGIVKEHKNDHRDMQNLRMSTKEKKELEGMEEAMDTVQQRMDAIDEEMNENSEDFIQLQKLSDERAALEVRLEELMEHWVYLTEKQQAINTIKGK